MYGTARFLRIAVGIGVVLHAVTLSAASLWFGDKAGLHRIDTATNQVASSIAFEPAVAIAANATDGSIWVLSQERLAHLSEQGVIQFKVAVRDLGTGLGAPRLLVLKPNDGSVWAGFENRILHVDAAGVVRHALPLRARDLAVAQDGSVWVLTESALQQHDSSAALIRSVALPGAQRLKHLALDDAGGAVWVAGERELVQLSLSAPEQTLLSILAPETISGISVDLQTGDLWLFGKNGLFSYGRAGTPRVSRDLRDFSIANPQTLLFDFATQAAWVGHQGGLTRITVAGTVAATFPGAPHVVAIAIGRTPLAIVPVVSIAAPADGAVVNTGRPQLRVDYDALCGAVRCGFPNSFFSTFTLSALLNGIETGSLFVFDPATGGASLTPVTRLPEGLNTFSAQARDSFGRFSDTGSSTFTIDTIAPSFSNVTPATGSVFPNASIAIAGSVDDPAASVTLGGQTQGASFSFAVTLGSVGSNTFTLLARDAAGNTASLPLTYVYDPPNVLPLAAITSPVNGANFTAPASFSVTASAGDSDGSVVRVDFFSNGVLIGSDAVAPYTAALSGLAIGSYSLTAQATDNRGGVGTSDPVSVSVGPPNALPVVQLTTPAAGTQFFVPAAVRVRATASDADGTIAKVEFLRNGIVAATVTVPPYAATLANVPAGTHSLTARATDDRGAVTTSAAVTITMNTSSITIDSPAPNAAIASNTVVVRGRIVAAPYSGVVVNDYTAAVDAAGNYAVLVPVAAGSNTLTATVTMQDRTTITRSASVSATGEPSPFGVVAEPATGFAPLAPVFTVSNPNGVDATFTFDGYGPFPLPAGTRSQVTVTYPAGVFTPEIVITANGWAVTHPMVIESRDEAEMDRIFRALWSGMNDALVAGDKETAMRYLNDSARRRYGPVFEALLPFMPQIVASYSPLTQASISERIGEYAVTRMDGATKRLYLIYFLRDATGVWRIDGM
jgi:PAS domain-containing protein